MIKRKVLIPLDGSDFSRQIMRVVLDFFDPRDVALVLLRVAPPPSMPLEVSSPRDMLVGNYPLTGSYETYSSAVERGYVEVEHEMQSAREGLIAEMRPEADRLHADAARLRIEAAERYPFDDRLFGPAPHRPGA